MYTSFNRIRQIAHIPRYPHTTSWFHWVQASLPQMHLDKLLFLQHSQTDRQAALYICSNIPHLASTAAMRCNDFDCLPSVAKPVHRCSILRCQSACACSMQATAAVSTSRDSTLLTPAVARRCPTTINFRFRCRSSRDRARLERRTAAAAAVGRRGSVGLAASRSSPSRAPAPPDVDGVPARRRGHRDRRRSVSTATTTTTTTTWSPQSDRRRVTAVRAAASHSRRRPPTTTVAASGRRPSREPLRTDADRPAS